MVLQCVSILSIDHLTLYCKACPGKMTLKSDYLPAGALEVVPKNTQIQIHSLVFSTLLPHIPQAV